MRYLQKNESRKDKLLEELETLQGSENAIQQKIIEYLAMSCPDLIRQDISTTKSSNGTTTNAPENLNDRKKNTTIQTINQEQTTIEVDKTIKEIQQKMAAATELAKTDNITPTPEQTAQAEAQLKANGIRSQIEHNPLLSSNQELKNGYIYIFILSNLPINPLRTQTSLIVLSSIA
ncbi:MAG: hypothetical protein LBP53_00035 [Candidatus Peribacteria bacterium]|jgi:hypothetical protein|nr:hypothetical protein [Candidatus Peribacteria bacterium]